MSNPFETFDATIAAPEATNIESQMAGLNKAFSPVPFDTPMPGTPEGDYVRAMKNMGAIFDGAAVSINPSNFMDEIQKLLYGAETEAGHTMGLIDISERKMNAEYFHTNLRQQAGFTAEIISTAKDNLNLAAKGMEERFFHADDLPELFKKNDPFVDKVLLDAKGNVINTIQTKFIGRSGQEWVDKMMLRKYDKYYDGNVDIFECPKNFYDGAMTHISELRTKYEGQIARMAKEGNTEAVENLTRKIDKLNQLEARTMKSSVTTHEAEFARLFPKSYVAKLFNNDLIDAGNAEGLRQGKAAAAITFTVSTATNISAFLDGQITPEDLALNIASETTTAGILGYGTAFISNTAAALMQGSGSALIQKIGGTCAPAAMVSFAVESFSDFNDFATGKIGGTELGYNLGEHASGIAGSMAGASAGAALGTVLGPAGTVIGGVLGGVVGCAITTEAYATAVELATPGAEALSQQATQFATETISKIKSVMPEQALDAQQAFDDFFDLLNTPIMA